MPDPIRCSASDRRNDQSGVSGYGSVATEDQVLTLVPDGDGYLIDADR